jgi:hypothetical protein
MDEANAVKCCYGGYGFFLQFRDRVVESFPSLFGEGSQQSATDLTATAGFGKKWGWYQSIYGLAKGDITKFDTVTSEPLFKCLMYLTFEKEKNEIESNMIKKAMKR